MPYAGKIKKLRIDYEHFRIDEERIAMLRTNNFFIPPLVIGSGLHVQCLCSRYSSLTCSYSWPVNGQEQLICSFFKGFLSRFVLPRPINIPTWDLPTVLRALKRASLDPLQSVGLRALMPKTALLLTLVSVKCSLGLHCPMGVRAHSTRGIGLSVAEIYAATRWFSLSTFTKFYNLDVPALQAWVLSA